jgi:hypothetical protein
MSKKDKGRLPPFIPLHHDMMDCPAWRAMSHGAKYLYLSLKRRASFAGNRAYLSYRLARQELKAGPQKIKEWYAELQHYGFIELAQHGCLGVNGKGKAPHWRLTEKGQAGSTGELPSKEYLRWDGVLFDPRPYRRVTTWNATKLQKQNPVSHAANTPSVTSVTPALALSVTPEMIGGTHGVHIEHEQGASHVAHITKLTTRGGPEGLFSALKIPSETLVAQNEARLLALDATKERKHEGATMENVVSPSEHSNFDRTEFVQRKESQNE